MSKSCENCAFFQAKNKFCRRFPPQPVVIEILESNGKRRDIVVSKFPVVVHPEFDYCGEFQEKDELLEG
jgi:hypothetical protein